MPRHAVFMTWLADASRYFDKHGCGVSATYARDIATELDRLHTEVADLRKIVAQLPQCWRLVNGELIQDEPVVPGMKLYAPNQLGNPDISETVASEVGDYSIWANSPEAAEALGNRDS